MKKSIAKIEIAAQINLFKTYIDIAEELVDPDTGNDDVMTAASVVEDIDLYGVEYAAAHIEGTEPVVIILDIIKRANKRLVDEIEMFATDEEIEAIIAE